jgi:transient receptor potential cation channel subfamily C member 4
VAGKKGKIMERRIMKDFQIGIVDDILSKTMAASASSGGNINDVFGAIAKAIGKKSK